MLNVRLTKDFQEIISSTVARRLVWAGSEIINVVILNIMNCLDVLHEVTAIFPFENFRAELAGYLVIAVSPGLFSMAVLTVVIPRLLVEKL